MKRSPEKPLELQAAELQHELEEEKNRHLRTLADFDNYRKRMERERDSISLSGKKQVIKDLLPALDNLERAMGQVQEDSVKQGLVMVRQQFFDILKQHGLELIECKGQIFNPAEHEGVGFIEDEHCPPGHVAEELLSGYRLGQELLRPAAVRVAKGR
ncbi:GrpE protein [Desulfofarcimen acetoxidans DSM 771]|uniref:Protein GrpE n=1 Tax=Desulfofarcimen acetoxidans (strain ATCC 49208 / DSM 771 / KCTC 5769 / VKM B-1644 / 5575) TaxID=485916 RepID=C8VYF8_DESAS|nr:nucleotide exchange factor GrpE [Desulfofarcimen acetoxidans]ACV62839.1 GrpE protein [Desulfofarcimen acetoxidans DSM 771]